MKNTLIIIMLLCMAVECQNLPLPNQNIALKHSPQCIYTVTRIVTEVHLVTNTVITVETNKTIYYRQLEKDTNGINRLSTYEEKDDVYWFTNLFIWDGKN